jgi:C4-dicarboxylate-specific signal transduction histidine kinase
VTKGLPLNSTGEHLSLLLRTSRLLCSTLDTQQVLETLMSQAIEVLGAERGLVMLREDESQEWQFRAASALDQETVAKDDFKISRGLVESVAREGKSVLTSDALQDARFRDQASVTLYHLRSILCVPIVITGRVLGVIYVDHRLASGAFETESQELLEAIANQAAIALENALLYEKLQRVHETSMALARAELAESQAALMHASKMAAVGQLAAGVAHEINNPLGALFLQISGMRAQLPEHPVLPRLAVCEAALGRCKTIVQRLLTFSQKRSRPDELVALEEVVQGTLQLVAPDLRRCDIQLHPRLETGLKVKADGAEIGQVLLNLVLNARDALMTRPSGRELTVTACRVGSEVQLEVRDNGPGLAPEAVGRIFEPFFTTKPVGQGIGLGLSICYQLMQQNGGSIRVESNHGCRFVLELPC